MIAAWMLGATLFALLLGVAAIASERALRHAQRATRTPWVIALACAVVWPAAAPVVLRQFQSKTEAAAVIVSSSAQSPATIVARQLPDIARSWEQNVAIALVLLWIATTSFMLFRLFYASRMLTAITRKAQRMQLDGEPVLVTESLGPAVVGLWRPTVAVPAWFLQLDASLRSVVLRHESEHCRSRDPQLVWLASVAVALMPWNAGVWFLSRRLRLALEIDCDARTLRSELSTEKYSRLLLLIAQRQSTHPLVAMLAESTSHLSRRITAMQMTPLRRPAVRVALLAGVATAAIAVACSPRIASDLTGPNVQPQSATAAKLAAEKAGGSPVYFESQVEQPVGMAPGSPSPTYPEALKAGGVNGKVLAMFVVNEQGLAEPSTLKVLRTDNAQFEQSVRDALPTMRFTPAKVGGRPVKQLVQQPFAFGLTVAEARKGDETILSTAGTKSGVKAGFKPADEARAQPLTSREVVRTLPVVTASGAGQAEQPRATGTPTQVANPVFAPGSPMPAFPELLKSAGVGGSVLAMFVVNRDGTADSSSVKILKSDHAMFTNAVLEALPKMRFEPPMLDGRAVRQLVQQPFAFSLSKP